MPRHRKSPPITVPNIDPRPPPPLLNSSTLPKPPSRKASFKSSRTNYISWHSAAPTELAQYLNLARSSNITLKARPALAYLRHALPLNLPGIPGTVRPAPRSIPRDCKQSPNHHTPDPAFAHMACHGIIPLRYCEYRIAWSQNQKTQSSFLLFSSYMSQSQSLQGARTNKRKEKRNTKQQTN